MPSNISMTYLKAKQSKEKKNKKNSMARKRIEIVISERMERWCLKLLLFCYSLIVFLLLFLLLSFAGIVSTMATRNITIPLCIYYYWSDRCILLINCKSYKQYKTKDTEWQCRGKMQHWDWQSVAATATTRNYCYYYSFK